MPRTKMEKPPTSRQRRVQKHFGSGEVIPAEPPAILAARAAQRTMNAERVEAPETPELDED